MPSIFRRVVAVVLVPTFVLAVVMSASAQADGLQRIKYNNPGLVVDLGVGLWAWPVPCALDPRSA